jgi:hypothetical protein
VFAINLFIEFSNIAACSVECPNLMYSQNGLGYCTVFVLPDIARRCGKNI